MLDHMNRRLHRQQTFERAISTILDDARALNGAEFGNLQLCAGDHLLMVAHRSFDSHFLRTFREVLRDDGTACGRALRSGKTVLVEDVERDEDFAPYRSAARTAGFRSVATTPLVTSRRQIIGVVSTHFTTVHRPTAFEIAAFEQYCLGASNFLWELRGERSVTDIAVDMSSRLYDRRDASSIGETPAPY
jgi:GAF domain-containing protein